jgi:SAM-dependent methyltransferase
MKLKKLVHRFINKIYYKIDIPHHSGGKILDIGCGDGKGLLKLKEDGWETFGVEISPLASEHARNNLGLNIFTGTVEDAQYEDEFFDIIILNHVLEHLSYPKTTLTEINRILKHEGELIISIPNVNSFEARHFKKYWSAWELPRHLYHFTPSTIRLLLDKTGFEVINIEYDNNPNNILSSFKYVFEDNRINPMLGLIFLFPFANLASLILGKTKRSYNMAVFSKKKVNFCLI